jgi:hypothetical protein
MHLGLCFINSPFKGIVSQEKEYFLCLRKWFLEIFEDLLVKKVKSNSLLFKHPGSATMMGKKTKIVIFI